MSEKAAFHHIFCGNSLPKTNLVGIMRDILLFKKNPILKEKAIRKRIFLIDRKSLGNPKNKLYKQKEIQLIPLLIRCNGPYFHMKYTTKIESVTRHNIKFLKTLCDAGFEKSSERAMGITEFDMLCMGSDRFDYCSIVL